MKCSFSSLCDYELSQCCHFRLRLTVGCFQRNEPSGLYLAVVCLRRGAACVQMTCEEFDVRETCLCVWWTCDAKGCELWQAPTQFNDRDVTGYSLLPETRNTRTQATLAATPPDVNECQGSAARISASIHCVVCFYH